MTKDKAIQQWFEGFGMTAYPQTAVPDDTKFPWLTYEYISSSWGDQPVGITVNMWFWTDSEALPNEKAEEFRRYIEEHDTIFCDEGAIWVKTGEPYCQALTDDVSKSIKRRYINITFEYWTT